MMARTVLALDVGNSRVKAGVFVDGQLQERVQWPTDASLAVDGYCVQMQSLFALWPQLDACLMASVVRGMAQTLVQAVQAVWSVVSVVVNTDMDLGIAVDVPKPAAVGMDRLLEAREAYHLVHGAVVVAAFGSAITVDLVTGDGVFRGGTILPGLRTGLRALHLHTSLLPDLAVEEPTTVLGTDTVSCMHAGVVYGAAGAVDRIFDALCDVAGEPATLVLTGGDAGLVAKFMRSGHQIEPDLVLRGLVSLDAIAQ